MSAAPELAYLSLVEVSRLIAGRELSPVDLVDALLARIERLDGRLCAFVTLDPEGALDAARRAEAEIAREGVRGPLHGIPVALKDIIDAAGLPTTCQSRIRADHVAATDACVTAKLKSAGAILLGKLTTHEFAVGGPSFDLPWPPARNPWDLSKMPGGSSSGGGTALAAGLVPAALGSDTAGSIRNPSAMCGTVGLKPSFGLVGRSGVFPLSETLDHVGPMTRTVEDNALMLNTLAGFDGADPGSRAGPETDYTSALGEGVKDLRIGVVRHFHERDEPADDGTAAALDTAFAVLMDLGAALTTVELAPLADYTECNRVILSFESYRIHARWLTERAGDYGALARERIGNGANVTVGDYAAALARRDALRAGMERCLDGLDALICASNMVPAYSIDDEAEIARNYMRHARAPFNVTGHPALGLPIGFSPEGLPLGMQIAGRAFDEKMLYRIGRAYEQACGWHHCHPDDLELSP
jgi:aspartyl-tRNA(Asn)/glutamyl-tRNA(Gln) amidotransferase subunit A